MNLGGRVEQERNERGWSQTELAHRVRQLGGSVTQTGIDKLEKRDAKNPKIAAELAAVLSVSERWLRSGKGPKVALAAIDGQLAELPEDVSAELVKQFNLQIKAVKLGMKFSNDD